MSAVANALGMSRQHFSSAMRKGPARRCGRPQRPGEELIARKYIICSTSEELFRN